MSETGEDAMLRIFKWVMDNPEAVAKYLKENVKQLETPFGILEYLPHPMFNESK